MSAHKAYWARMTPEQRQKEMRRRQRVSLKKGGHMGIRSKLNPKSEAAVRAALEEKKIRVASFPLARGPRSSSSGAIVQ